MFKFSDRWIPPPGGVFTSLFIALLAVQCGRATAADTGAVGDGDWSSAATWTGGVPGPLDNAYIGVNYFTGSAATATVTLSQDSSAALLYLGYTPGFLGVVDLNGHTLNTQTVYFGNSASIARTGGGTLNISSQLSVLGGSYSFGPNDSASAVSIVGGTSATTAGIKNLVNSVFVAPGGTLTLGNDLAMDPKGTIDVRGTFNANGHTLSTGTLYLGTNAGPVTFANRGPIIGAVWVSSQYTPGLTTFNLLPTDAITTLALGGVSTSLTPDVGVQNLVLNSTAAVTATATTSDSNNITKSVTVGPGATLTLGSDLTCAVSLTGTLDFNGHAINTAGAVTLGGPTSAFTLLNRGSITAGSLDVDTKVSQGQITFNLITADHIGTLGLAGVATTFPTGASVQTLYLNSLSFGNFGPVPSTATTSAAGNITAHAYVYSGNILSLGAALTCSLDLGGNLNANGYTISGTTVNVGLISGPADIQNDGLVNVATWNEQNASKIRLNHSGDVLRRLLLSGNSSLTFGDAAGQTTGVTVNSLSVEAGSILGLEVNGQADGWVFRWANAAGGNHTADLQALIAGGEIVFTSLNGGSYSLSADLQYTYINVVPEPGTLALTLLAGGALVGLRQRRKLSAR